MLRIGATLLNRLGRCDLNNLVQEEEEQGTLKGGEGKERHHLLQQLRRERAERQGEKGHHKIEPSGADTCTGIAGGRGLHCGSHDNSLLLYFLQCPLRDCES